MRIITNQAASITFATWLAYNGGMISVAVLMGGTSSEREISLRSGSAVASALQEAGYSVISVDIQTDIEHYLPALKKCDVVFPVLHGKGGEDGVIQKFFEEHDLRFVGSDSISSTLCANKWEYKKKLEKAEVLTPKAALVTSQTIWSHPFVTQPFVLKPYDGGSSIDTFIVRNTVQVDTQRINEALARHDEMLLEQLIEGSEITVGVLNQTALPVIEIIPPDQGEFDYENKYNGSTQELCPPVNIKKDVQAKAQAIAVAVHELTGCRDMSRTDFMVDAENDLYVLETNTIPGMTDQSLFPKAAATAGISMSDLVDKLIQAALARPI